MTRIVIADDHAMFRQGLSLLLRSRKDMEVVGEADDGEKALRLILELDLDLAILDLSMPTLSGIDVMRAVRREGCPTRVILVTMHTRPELAVEAIEEGVAGDLLKANAFEDLLQAVETVLRGGTFISPQVSAAIYRSPRSENRDGLTAKEKEVLRYIADGLTCRQIAGKLFISANTVATHRARIMTKLDMHSTAELVRYALQKGINKKDLP